MENKNSKKEYDETLKTLYYNH